MSAGYAFANRPGESLHRPLIGHLADVLDDHTVDVLAPYVQPGMPCLVVGAGASAVPGWLAESGAQVTAVDIEPANVPPAVGVTVQGLDLATDPVPGGWGLIHARAVLAHLGRREEVLGKLAAALAPGGALMVEEFVPHHGPEVIRSPDPEAGRLLAAYQQALVAIMQAAGTSPTWSRDLSSVMEVAGLFEVTADYWARQWRGGQAGTMLPYTMLEHRRDALIDAGMDAADVDHLRELLLDPRLVITNTTIVTAQGVRP